MCSDGLSDMVQDPAIAKIVRADGSLEHKAQMLIDLANDNGGRDNISVLMVEVHEAAEKRGLIARLLGK
jgi:protein phosphatase